jgi:hypothetical protein
MPYCFNVDECKSGNHASLIRLNGSHRMGTYLCTNPACLAKALAIHGRDDGDRDD